MILVYKGVRLYFQIKQKVAGVTEYNLYIWNLHFVRLLKKTRSLFICISCHHVRHYVLYWHKFEWYTYTYIYIYIYIHVHIHIQATNIHMITSFIVKPNYGTFKFTLAIYCSHIINPIKYYFGSETQQRSDRNNGLMALYHWSQG